ncbi:BtrH N-terminal domain-containing protein [Paenibacillus wulumuqiensis]|uniref:BtrH N-terminal domain-containing protein n=1 Tax=Paenibacillus wulumuqiensis TaxID=1567107 RepID=UPI0006195D07|nr:BtrH N-terminal domain-containing protein [Paenibacillus wulumuqiensis]
MSISDKTILPLLSEVHNMQPEHLELMLGSEPSEAGAATTAGILTRADNHFVINHCYYGAKRAMLKQRNIHMDETDVYFLSNGISFGYNGDIHTFGLRPIREMLAEWISHTGIELVCIDTESVQQDQADILQEWHRVLSLGNTVLLHVKTENLVYNPLYTDNPGKTHMVQLYGLHPQENLAYVGDHFLLDSSGAVLGYSGSTSLSELLEGTVEYAYMNNEEKITMEEQQIVSICADHLTEFLNGEDHGSQGAWGIAAYRRLIRDMEEVALLDGEAFTEACDTIYYHLRIESLSHLMRYTDHFIGKYQHLLGDQGPLLQQEITALNQDTKRHLLQLYKMGLQKSSHRMAAYIQRSTELMDRVVLHLSKLQQAASRVTV